MNEKIMDWFKTQISAGNIAVIVFMAAGFYYTTEYRITALETDIQETDVEIRNHIQYEFKPLRNTVQQHSEELQKMTSNYTSLRDLIEQQQSNDDQRYERIESRLDYIIKRLDNQ